MTDQKKLALLVLDAQNDFFARDNPNIAAFDATLPVINEVVGYFRDGRLPVVFVQHTSSKKPEGSAAWMIYEGFDTESGDPRILKSFPDAFWESELDAQLRSIDVNVLIISGFLSEHCVLSTYRGALQRGYAAYLLEGGIASLKDEHTEFTLRISERVSLDNLRGMLANGEKGAR
ncbi:MAG: cysteine hydrolase family protein [Anaerolineales bacterium]